MFRLCLSAFGGCFHPPVETGGIEIGIIKSFQQGKLGLDTCIKRPGFIMYGIFQFLHLTDAYRSIMVGPLLLIISEFLLVEAFCANSCDLFEIVLSTGELPVDWQNSLSLRGDMS